METSPKRDFDIEHGGNGGSRFDDAPLRRARQEVMSLADAGREEAHSQLEGIAQAFTDAGERLRERDQAMAGHMSDAIGRGVDTASRYLREHDAYELSEVVGDFARRNPLAFMIGCAVTGLAIGRFFKASPSSTGRARAGAFDDEPVLPATVGPPVTAPPPATLDEPSIPPSRPRWEGDPIRPRDTSGSWIEETGDRSPYRSGDGSTDGEG